MSEDIFKNTRKKEIVRHSLMRARSIFFKGETFWGMKGVKK